MTVVVGARRATFVKLWGDRAAVVRFDDAPADPKVVPLERILPVPAQPA